MQGTRVVQAGVTQLHDSVHVRAQESASNQRVDLCHRGGVEVGVLAGDDRGVGQRLGHARDVESSRNRQHPLLGPQYGIAVEIGHHEPADAVKHLAHVEVAVALDDRGAREHSESAQDRLDLAAPSTCNRNACGIWQRTNDFQSLERSITPAGCVLCRGDSPCHQAPRRGHAVEPGVAKHSDPQRGGVRPLLQMGRPLDHSSITDSWSGRLRSLFRSTPFAASTTEL